MTPNLDEPKTIEELRSWFKERGYEPAQTRFFVGVDFRAPKAFGIYLDEFGEYVVYKNKADGTRVIRYQGYDQEYAVHELYQRFQQEIINQQTRWAADRQARQAAGNRQTGYSVFDAYERKQLLNNRGRKLPIIVLLVFLSFVISVVIMRDMQKKLGWDFGLLMGFIPLVIMGVVMLLSYVWLNGMKLSEYLRTVSPSLKATVVMLVVFYTLIFSMQIWGIRGSGYYSLNNHLYYRAGNAWYQYDDSRNIWVCTSNVPNQFDSGSWKDYNNTDSHYGYFKLFETTSYYEDWQEEQRSYEESHHSDSDYSWSSNDWDSGYTDWDSDW